MGALLLLLALTPPTGYDALMYHLEAPRRFLELGGMAVLPDVEQGNMPLTVEMLYIIGMAFGSLEMANLTSLALAVLVVCAIFSFGRAFVDERVGLLAALVFLTSPSVSMFAPMPDIEFGMVLFEFMAVYAVARWVGSQDRRYLLVAGLLSGFALGSKYLGGITPFALGVFLVASLVRTHRERSLSQMLGLILLFAVPAGLVAAPWYLKNLLWL